MLSKVDGIIRVRSGLSFVGSFGNLASDRGRALSGTERTVDGVPLVPYAAYGCYTGIYPVRVKVSNSFATVGCLALCKGGTTTTRRRS